MFKRTVWFTVGAVTGAVTGAGASVYAYVRLREERGRLAPDRVADSLVDSARTVGRGARAVGSAVGGNVRAAVAEGREAMAEANDRIVADIERRPRPARPGELLAPVQGDSRAGPARRAQ
jgi:hypothetical protein